VQAWQEAAMREHAGSERRLQRIDQELASGIHAADVINGSDASRFISWKKNGWLFGMRKNSGLRAT
jgi:ABC-type Fe3+ transport system substrate-binding protein